MKKNTKNNSQYFQADLSLLKSVASKGDFRLLSAMLILNRFANGVPKTSKEQPFSITYAGAKAIIPYYPNRQYEILTIYRPRFRFSHSDVALWQKMEVENISNFIDKVDEFLQC